MINLSFCHILATLNRVTKIYMGHSLRLYIFRISSKLEKEHDTNCNILNNVSQCNTSVYLINIIKNIYLTVNTILILY